MKKLVCLLLALLCCAALTGTVFADLIITPGMLETENTAAAAETASTASGSPISPTVLYLAIGALAIAAAFGLFLLLRKKAK